MPVKHVSRKRILDIVGNPAWVCFTWFGMTAGVSLLATPVRFTAETITRAVALDVGQVVFAALHKAEFAALILLLVLIRVSGFARRLWAESAALALILIAQSLWLLPELSARTQLIIAGGEPTPSHVHASYSILELLKLILLPYLGFRASGLTVEEQNAPTAAS